MVISGNMENDSLNENFSTLLMGKSPGKRGSNNFMEVEESTTYEDYPPRKPFINDPYERPPYKSVSTYPEGNRTAVVDALRNLQHKIHTLELERTTAEDKLKSLARETSKYQDTLQRESEQRKPSQTSVSKHNQELESQLSVAETRCQLLEKQLENMRNMVSNAEKGKISAISKTIEIERLQEPVEHSSSFQENLRKIHELERDQIKLTANQTLAESKIRELEERLGEERHHRKVIVEKAAEIESVQKANRILQAADEREREEFKKPHKVKRASKKKKKVVSKKSGHCHKTDPSKHYRLNLNDIPFVAGKNTGPSYAVGANVQNVLSLMKSHNMALCSRATYAGGSCGSSTPSSSESSSPSTEHDLAEILLQLQDEFHQMSFEHQELSKEIGDSDDPRMREDMERELEALVSRMEAKSLQISKIRRHQEKVANKKKKKLRRNSDGEEYSSPRSGHKSSQPRVSASPSPRYSGEVEVTTTIRPKGAGAGVVQIRPSSAREISLNVLKDMKKLQSTLRKDDLSWK